MSAPPIQSIVGIVAQGDRLRLAAVGKTGDVNESYLVVHGVIVKALQRHAANKVEQSLDLALACALYAWRGGARRGLTAL